ncbi:MAG: DMT family transporter [Gammaproteobacteria bacterium]|nr:DMT family transporter [Gammaproteobacteria bacterium]MDE0279821.1 DMT family transporter [Gammaproteobacteria bacterium]
MQPRLSSAKALLSLVVMGVLWGLQFSMLKFAALSEAGIIDILMLMLVFLSLVYSAYVLYVGDSLRFPASWIPFLLITALLGYVLPLGITLLVAPYIAVGTISLIACLAPIVTVALALAFRTEQVSASRVFAIVLGLVSTLLILLPELQLPGLGALGWMVVALGIALVYGIEPVYVHARWPAAMTSPQLIAGEAIAAAVLLLPFFLLKGNPLGLLSLGRDALWPLAVYVLAGIVETLLYFHLIRTTGGVFVSFGTFVSLFAGIAWGMLLFSEKHAMHVWLAVVFLIGALFLCSRSQTREARAGDDGVAG